MSRPTRERVAEARKDVVDALEQAEANRALDNYHITAIRTLLTITEPLTNEQCATESACFYKNGVLRPLSAKQRILYAYESGMRREYRS